MPVDGKFRCRSSRSKAGSRDSASQRLLPGRLAARAVAVGKQPLEFGHVLRTLPGTGTRRCINCAIAIRLRRLPQQRCIELPAQGSGRHAEALAKQARERTAVFEAAGQGDLGDRERTAAQQPARALQALINQECM